MPEKNQELSLKKVITGTDLFLNLSPETKENLARGFRKISIPRNKIVIRQGEPGDSLYLVAKGSFSVLVTEDGEQKKVGEVKRGSCFGEGALITSEPRNATVVCNEPGVVYRISREEFEKILKNHPHELHAFARLIARRARALHKSVFRPEPHRLKKLIESVAFFADVEEELISELEPQIEWVFLPGGETLMKQGDPADGMYIVVNGSLRYEVRGPKNNLVSGGVFSHGDIIGEIALLTGEPRTATVVATLSSEIVRISRAAFEAVFSKHPPTLLALTKLIAQRFTSDRMHLNTVRTVRSIVTLFPLQKEISVADIAAKLQKALKKSGRTYLAESRHFRKKIGSSKYSISKLLEWLHEVQTANEFVILCPDFGDKIWTETILHYTNRILLLSDARAGGKLSTEEIRYLGDSYDPHAPHRELVLLYSEDNARPANTSSLKALRKPDAVRHIRTDSQSAFEGLARFITGRSIGVALGGGGAKGFAHIGLLKALREEGIPIDMIGGTSAGAIMAGIYAMGYDTHELEKIAKSSMSDRKNLNDYTISGVSLTRGKKFNSAIKKFVQDTMIEDLWLPYFSVATNLTKAEVKVIDSGSLWKALRASASIPGILPPFYEKGELLVDGAMLDNIPGAIMREKGAGFVISVGLASDTDESADEIFGGIYEESNPGALPSAWRSLFRRLLGKTRRQKLPGLLQLLMRATFVASDAAVAKTKAESDIFIHLPVEKFGLFDWKKFRQLVDIGYAYGKAHAKSWKKQIGQL